MTGKKKKRKICDPTNQHQKNGPAVKWKTRVGVGKQVKMGVKKAILGTDGTNGGIRITLGRTAGTN